MTCRSHLWAYPAENGHSSHEIKERSLEIFGDEKLDTLSERSGSGFGHSLMRRAASRRRQLCWRAANPIKGFTVAQNDRRNGLRRWCRKQHNT